MSFVGTMSSIVIFEYMHQLNRFCNHAESYNN